MNNYQGVPLGVESAWPAPYKGKDANRRRSTLVAVLGAVLAVAGLALLAGCTKPQAHTAAPDTIEIRAQVTGLLERQAFADGARVKKGELLYLIDPRPFEAQRAQATAGLAQ